MGLGGEGGVWWERSTALRWMAVNPMDRGKGSGMRGTIGSYGGKGSLLPVSLSKGCRSFLPFCPLASSPVVYANPPIDMLWVTLPQGLPYLWRCS